MFAHNVFSKHQDNPLEHWMGITAEGHKLHAWVEAYLPGGGWVGLDPSLGLFVNENYIPLACSSEARNTLPIHGNYGGMAKSRLNTIVKITESLEN